MIEPENMQTLRNLKRAVEQSAGVVVITDKAGNIQYVNPRFSAVTGYDAQEAVGLNPRVLKSGFQPDSLYKDLWDTILAGMNWKGELLNRRKDGTLYWAMLSISPVKDENGDIVSFIAIQDDITQLKDMQAELTAKNEELQSVLSSLQDAQVFLIQQEKMAGIGMLAAGVSHEINNPLGFVNSNFETLKRHLSQIMAWISVLLQEDALETTDPETALGILRHLKAARGWSKAAYIVNDVRELLPDMQSGITRITDIVKNLRDFSQVDFGNRITEYDFCSNIVNAVMLISSDLSSVAALDMQLSPLDPINANGAEINQVLINMLTNAVQAVKSSHDGSMGKIRIRTDQDKDNVMFFLEDDGPGVPAELRARIFEPFFTTKPVGEGAGLGLGIAHDIVVRRHKGTLSVEDSDLGGARFVLTLPKEAAIVEEQQAAVRNLLP